MKNLFVIFLIGISLKGVAQTNLDFEDWPTNFNGVDEAKNWINTSDASEFDAPQVLFKTKHLGLNGNSAVKLITAYWPVGESFGVDTLVGSIVQETTFFKQPKSFEFSYQAVPKNGDAVLVGVRLSTTVNDSDIIVGEGFFTSFEIQNTWKKQVVNIKYYSNFTPDKISIVALSSANAVLDDGSSGYAKVGSTLLLDNVKIGGQEEEFKPSYYMYVFPNPAKDYINIETNDPAANTIAVFNLSGKQMLSQPIIIDNKTKVDISGLISGTYVYKVSGDSGVITTNKFNVVR